MSPRRIKLFIITSIAALVVTLPAHACSCARSSQAQAIKSSDVVFQGRVVDVRREKGKLFATLTVVRPIKGNVRTNVEVGTRAQSASCGYPFRRGQVLIVGARFSQRQYTTNMCLMFSLNKN